MYVQDCDRASERARAAMRWHCVLGFCPAVRLLLIAAPSRQYSRRGSALVVCDGFVAAPLCSRPPVVGLLARCLGWQRCCCCCCCLMPLSCDQSARCTAVRHHSAAELSRASLSALLTGSVASSISLSDTTRYAKPIFRRHKMLLNVPEM